MGQKCPLFGRKIFFHYFFRILRPKNFRMSLILYGLGLGPGLISLGRLGLGRISLGRPRTWNLLGICVPTSPKGYKLLEDSLILNQE